MDHLFSTWLWPETTTLSACGATAGLQTLWTTATTPYPALFTLGKNHSICTVCFGQPCKSTGKLFSSISGCSHKKSYCSSEAAAETQLCSSRDTARLQNGCSGLHCSTQPALHSACPKSTHMITSRCSFEYSVLPGQICKLWSHRS